MTQDVLTAEALEAQALYQAARKNPACRQPIDAICKDGCTYDEQLKKWEADAREYCRGGSLFRFVVGSCGDLRYLSSNHTFGGEAHYFDSTGKMISAETRSDDIDPQCHGQRFYGEPVNCERKPGKDLCREE